MFKQFKNRKAFARAEEAKADNEIICATLIDEKPVYFTMPSSASESEVREKAFEVRTGREMSKIERTLVEIVEVQR